VIQGTAGRWRLVLIVMQSPETAHLRQFHQNWMLGPARAHTSSPRYWTMLTMSLHFGLRTARTLPPLFLSAQSSAASSTCGTAAPIRAEGTTLCRHPETLNEGTRLPTGKDQRGTSKHTAWRSLCHLFAGIGSDWSRSSRLRTVDLRRTPRASKACKAAFFAFCGQGNKPQRNKRQ